MIKDQETRKWLGIVFVLRDDYVSSLDDVEFKELKPIFEQLQLDVLIREDGPFPVGSEERKNVCEENDIVLEELFDRSPDFSKKYVVEFQRLNDHLKTSTKVWFDMIFYFQFFLKKELILVLDIKIKKEVLCNERFKTVFTIWFGWIFSR